MFSRDYYSSRTRKLLGIRAMRGSVPGTVQVLLWELTGAEASSLFMDGAHPLYGTGSRGSFKRTYLCPDSWAEALTRVKAEVAKLEKSATETERSLSRRSFELRDERSQKFWIIELDGASVEICFGRIPKDVYHGYHGKIQRKDHATPEKAQSAYDKLIQQKLKSGYVECHARRAKSTPKRGK